MYHGKVIYNPSGKAGEYSYWAANFYNGCSAKCEYCYNRKGITAKVLGGDMPTLKKCLQNPKPNWIKDEFAMAQFCEEADKNIEELRKHGLFFNFVSDPCLYATIQLNWKAISYCIIKEIPVKILTKQVWFTSNIKLNSWDNSNPWDTYIKPLLGYGVQHLISFGFTLTGHDELEPGAATNLERIHAGEKLHLAGFKLFGSFEPIIDLKSTFEMILLADAVGFDLYKIGLQSGKKYDPIELFYFIINVGKRLIDRKIYFKDSLLQQAGIKREYLPSNCVTRDFNL